jgi:hypothetical protein
MEPFRNNPSRQWNRRRDELRIIENERQFGVVVPCPKLDWLLDLFVQNGDTVFRPLEKLKAEFQCACGCQQRHNCAVGRGVSLDSDRHVFWYRTMRCRNKHAALLSGVSLVTIWSRVKVDNNGG